MDDFEKGLIHVLFAARCLTEAKLDEVMKRILPDFPDHVNVGVQATMKKLNKGLKKIGFEIKSVYMKNDETGEKTQYFAIANTESDQIAIDFGGPITEGEVPLFKKIIDHLLANKYESEHMLEKFKPVSWTLAQMGAYLERLNTDG
jgi:hypothetical protein